METIWVGVKLAFGLAIGFFIIRQIRGFLYTLKFTRVGCTYQKGEKPGTPSGWFTRDINLDDYLLWDDAHGVCLRMADPSNMYKWDEKQWQAWADKRGFPLDSSLGKRVREDSLQWNLSNESLEQFLSLAKEYWDFWKKEMRTEPRH
jgi:hypothetical protein